MKTKLKFFFDALTPKAGRANLRQHEFTFRKFFAVCLLVMVAQVGLAEDREGTTLLYKFFAYDDATTFNAGPTVVNSLGETMTLLDENDYHATGTRFAVRLESHGNNNITGTNKWYIHGTGTNNTTNRGLYCFFGSAEYLSIMGLAIGNKIKISWANLQNESQVISVRTSGIVKDLKNNTTLNANSTLESGREYEILQSGSLDLQVGRYTSITQVVIDDGGTTNHISFNTSGKYGTNNYGGVDYPYYRVQLSSRDFTEPTISTYPSTVTIDQITFSVDYTNIGVLNANPAYKGDVLFKNTGWCKVTAEFTLGGTTYSDSYVVEVWENDRTNFVIEESNTKYRLTGAGILTPAQRIVTDVTGITMTFGNSTSNTAIIEERKDNNDVSHYVSFMLADNGWWDRYPYDAYDWPNQGTYYIFEATQSGTLTFGGYKTSTGGEVKIVNANTLAHTVLFDGNTQGYLTTGSIVMTAGQKYYMHGTTPTVDEAAGEHPWDSKFNGQWAVFELEWFKFETGFSIVDPDDANKEITYGVAASSNVSEVTSREKISIPGVSVKSGSVVCKCGIKSADAEVKTVTVGETEEYHIRFYNIVYESGKTGGVIKVTLQNGGKEKDYVMTIPYGTHVWDFREDEKQGSGVTDQSYTDEQLCSMMKANGSDWSRPYKVHNTTTGEYKDPIMAAKSPINGNNAFYMDNTAGLIFVTGGESFGAQQTKNSTEGYAYGDYENATQYGYSYTTITGTDLVWMKGNATIYFPGVTAGQYIKIYTYRHADNKGETFSAKNLVDLDGVAYNANTRFIMRGMWEDREPGWVGDNIRGAAIFRVPSGYSPTQKLSDVPQLQLCDDGWTKIYRIEIMTDFKPDLMLTDDNDGTHYPVDYDGQFSSIVVRKNSRKDGALSYVDRSYLATTGQTGCQHANTCDYEIIADEGVVTVGREEWNSNSENPSKGTWYNKLKLRYNKAGRVRIVQRERANATGSGVSTAAPSSSLGYVIDKNEYFVNVGELTVQNYPYTWDFTNYNMYKGSSATKTNLEKSNSNWTKNGSTYGQNAKTTKDFCDGEAGEQNATTNLALFAQGAELCNSLGDVISETQGLGVSRPKTSKTYTYFATSDVIDPETGEVVMENGKAKRAFQEQHRNYDGYTLSNNAIQINGNNLTGVKEITIPEVDNGMYIFFESNANPNGDGMADTPADLTPLWNTTDPTHSDPFSVKYGVYIFKNNNTTKDFTFKVPANATITKIAVTDIVKPIYSTGYATESRDHAIDHTYQEKFTNHPVKAYAITTDAEGDVYEYRGKAEVRKSAALTVVPENTGVVLCQEGYSSTDGFSSPLFYPAVNNIEPTSSDESILATNKMAANVEETTHSSETETIGDVNYTKFIMTTVSYTYTKETGKPDTNTPNDEASTEAFYRMKLDATTSNNVIGANKAYLLIPTANLPTALWNGGGSSSRGLIYIDLEDMERNHEATSIDNEAIIDRSTDSGVYYSISGARINGKPTRKGFYIHNGKKVSVK